MHELAIKLLKNAFTRREYLRRYRIEDKEFVQKIDGELFSLAHSIAQLETASSLPCEKVSLNLN